MMVFIGAFFLFIANSFPYFSIIQHRISENWFRFRAFSLLIRPFGARPGHGKRMRILRDEITIVQSRKKYGKFFQGAFLLINVKPQILFI